jgi:hypothetical protein
MPQRARITLPSLNWCDSGNWWVQNRRLGGGVPAVAGNPSAGFVSYTLLGGSQVEEGSVHVLVVGESGQRYG